MKHSDYREMCSGVSKVLWKAHYTARACQVPSGPHQQLPDVSGALNSLNYKGSSFPLYSLLFLLL